MSDRTARWACKPRRNSPRVNSLKAPPPVGLRPPCVGAFKATRRRQTNRNHRKLSHKEWAETWGPIRSPGSGHEGTGRRVSQKTLFAHAAFAGRLRSHGALAGQRGVKPGPTRVRQSQRLHRCSVGCVSRKAKPTCDSIRLLSQRARYNSPMGIACAAHAKPWA